MPEKMFRVNIYDVGLDSNSSTPPIPFHEAIISATGQSLQDREKNVNGKWRRLEAHRRNGDIFLVNFVTFEYSGPGRVRSGRPTRDIAMQAGNCNAV